MQIPSAHQKRKPRIEIVPLIDIMFFLLATFMIVSLSMMSARGFGVNLAKSQTGVLQQTPAPSVISVKSDGSIFFDRQAVTGPALGKLLAQLKSRVDQPVVLIEGDRDVNFQSIVSTLDLVRKSGIERVSVLTETQGLE